MRVRATQKGYYGRMLRDIGDEFVLADPESDFAEVWMEDISGAERDPLDHDGNGRKGGSAPKPEPKPDPKPEPLKASIETTVTPPPEPVKKIDPITGKDI